MGGCVVWFSILLCLCALNRYTVKRGLVSVKLGIQYKGYKQEFNFDMNDFYTLLYGIGHKWIYTNVYKQM